MNLANSFSIPEFIVSVSRFQQTMEVISVRDGIEVRKLWFPTKINAEVFVLIISKSVIYFELTALKFFIKN